MIEAKAEDLARTFAGALNHKDKLVSDDQRDQRRALPFEEELMKQPWARQWNSGAWQKGHRHDTSVTQAQHAFAAASHCFFLSAS